MKLSRNLIWQTLGQGFGKLFTLIFYIVLPRLIGIEKYGEFSVILSIGLIIFQPFLELGLDYIIIKQVSRGQEGIVKQAFILRLMSSILGIVLVPAVAILFGTRWQALSLVYLYFVILSIQKIIFSRQRGMQRMKLEGLSVFAQRGLSLMLIFTLSRFVEPFLVPPLALLVSCSFVCIFITIFCWSWLKKVPEYAIKFSATCHVFQQGLTLACISWMGIIYFRIDTVMLGILSEDLVVGYYNLAYRLLEGLVFIPATIMIVSFPKLAQNTNFFRKFKRLIRVLIAIGLIGAAFTFWNAQVILKTIYGSSIEEVVPIFKILSLTFIPICIGHLSTQSLVAINKEKLYLGVVLGATLINVALNFFVIPKWQAQGAAMSTLFTESLVALACLFFVALNVYEPIKLTRS